MATAMVVPAKRGVQVAGGGNRKWALHRPVTAARWNEEGDHQRGEIGEERQRVSGRVLDEDLGEHGGQSGGGDDAHQPAIERVLQDQRAGDASRVLDRRDVGGGRPVKQQAQPSEGS